MKQIERVNLKDLKDELIKIPDEVLENCYVMHPFSSECDIEDLTLICMAEDWSNVFEKHIFELTNKFIAAVYQDAMIVAKCQEHPDEVDDYTDDTPT